MLPLRGWRPRRLGQSGDGRRRRAGRSRLDGRKSRVLLKSTPVQGTSYRDGRRVGSSRGWGRSSDGRTALLLRGGVGLEADSAVRSRVDWPSVPPTCSQCHLMGSSCLLLVLLCTDYGRTGCAVVLVLVSWYTLYWDDGGISAPHCCRCTWATFSLLTSHQLTAKPACHCHQSPEDLLSSTTVARGLTGFRHTSPSRLQMLVVASPREKNNTINTK